MRKRQTSISALGIATVRALESEKPEGERLYHDPYARQFIPGWMFGLIRLFDRMGYAERKGPGVMGFLRVRDRYIDDVLETHLAEGLAQLVVLGAGFDARAYRFPQLKVLRVFEVDHPASQAAKTEKLRKILGTLPPHVTYVGIDFLQQSLKQRLLESGYHPTARTLFIWQGVTQYLTPEAVDETLGFVANHSGARSGIVFDYIEPHVLADAGAHGEVKRMRRFRWMSGESLTFGIPIAEAGDFLEARGFTDVANVDGRWLERRYFPDGKQPVADHYGIAWARVA